MKNSSFNQSPGRRDFLKWTGLGAMTLGMQAVGCKAKTEESPAIQGFEKTPEGPASSKVWVPVSDRKIKVGLVGYSPGRRNSSIPDSPAGI